MTSVAVIGLGKLGAVLAGVLAHKGHHVTGVDLNVDAIDRVNNGYPPVEETGLRDLYQSVSGTGRLRATHEMSDAVAHSDIAFIIVPTPSGDDGRFVNQHVIDAVVELGECLRGQRDWYTVVICSTVMPGSTGGPIRAALEAASQRSVGHTLGLCYSPEFIALGSVIRDMTHPDAVLLGADDDRSRRELYDVLRTIPDSDPIYHPLSLVDAEIAKITVNTFVTMKISFANTIGELCSAIPGADAIKVLDAVGSDDRIGPKYLLPGGAFGGPCFPRDTLAFSALARSHDVSPDLAEATERVNLRQAERIVDSIGDVDQVGILGLAYKPHTNVTERSFGLDLQDLLNARAIPVVTSDPKVSMQVNGNRFEPDPQDVVHECDVVVIACPWPQFRSLDYRKVGRVIDVWGMLPAAPNIERFGRG